MGKLHVDATFEELAPLWEEVLDFLLRGMNNPEAREGAYLQLRLMAQLADLYNTLVKNKGFVSIGDAAARVVDELRGDRE
jgi:hypothetical protein